MWNSRHLVFNPSKNLCYSYAKTPRTHKIKPQQCKTRAKRKMTECQSSPSAPALQSRSSPQSLQREQGHCVSRHPRPRHWLGRDFSNAPLGSFTLSPLTSHEHELHHRARLAHCQPSRVTASSPACQCDPSCRCSILLAEFRVGCQKEYIGHQGELTLSPKLREENK